MAQVSAIVSFEKKNSTSETNILETANFELILLLYLNAQIQLALVR